MRAEAQGDGDGARLVSTGRRRAEILASEGRDEEAVVAGEAALAESVRTGDRWHRSEIQGLLAVSLIRSGRVAEAEVHAAESARLVRGEEDLSGMAEAEGTRAELLAARGEHEAADEAFRSAIATADRGEFRPLHMSLRLEWARSLLGRGRVAEAAALLAEAERLSPPPPWNFLATRRRELARAIAERGSTITPAS